jgi:hypothetical protein
MGWGKIGSVCSLKAIALACFLTPTTATVLPTTPAYAQFNIIIPGFGGFGYHGRRYGRRNVRHSRRGARRGGGGGGAREEPGEVSPGASGAGSPNPPTPGSGKKFRGTTDN